MVKKILVQVIKELLLYQITDIMFWGKRQHEKVSLLTRMLIESTIFNISERNLHKIHDCYIFRLLYYNVT